VFSPRRRFALYSEIPCRLAGTAGVRQVASTLLIVNPNAGPAPGRWSLSERVQSCLRSYGVDADVVQTRGAGDAAAAARGAAASGHLRVIVAGGDGTFNEAISGLADGHVPLGVIPVGTVNALALNLGLQPGDVDTACRAVAHGEVRRMDLGSVNGRHFANMAGVGLDALIVRDATGPVKTVFGRYAFIGVGLGHLARLDPWQYEATIDGARRSGEMWMLLIGNTPQYTWRVVLSPDAASDDGLLEFTFIGDCNRADFLRVVMDTMALGRSTAQNPHVQTIRGRHMHLHTDPPARWQVDGELGGLTPLDCTNRAGALPVIVPG